MFSVSTEMARRASTILDDKKARDITVLDIHYISSITDYFVIATGNSSTHIQALADEVEEKMDKEGYRIHHKEGYSSGRWILLDYGDIVVHVFSEEDRKFYSLERIWIDGKLCDFST